MPAKTADRIKAMRERAAALAPQLNTTDVEDAPVLAPDNAVAAVSAHFGAALDPLVRNRTVQQILVGQIAPDSRPEMRQPRLLPPPEELIVNDQPAPAYRELVGELLALGQSLKEQQIQPIVVYPGINVAYPAARYLILVGQRRWTAATLVRMETLDVIVVEAPTPADRVRIQYAENEDREEFSDMERAWALQQMKQALNDAPWEQVEERLQMSRARRQQLLRLTAFTAAQQEQVARLRLQETQLPGLRFQKTQSAVCIQACAMMNSCLHRWMRSYIGSRKSPASVPLRSRPLRQRIPPVAHHRAVRGLTDRPSRAWWQGPNAPAVRSPQSQPRPRRAGCRRCTSSWCERTRPCSERSGASTRSTQPIWKPC